MDPQFPERCERKMCATCGALIPGPALKCTVCKSFQDWRRYLPFDATILALLTALISVLATSVPRAIEWFEGGYSLITLCCEHDDWSGGVYLQAHNSGNRPGGIHKITLRIPLKDSQYKTMFEGYPVLSVTADKKDNDEYAVPPQNQKSIHITFDLKENDLPSKLKMDDFDGKCVISAETSEFPRRGIDQNSSPEVKPLSISIACNELSVISGRIGQ